MTATNVPAPGQLQAAQRIQPLRGDAVAEAGPSELPPGLLGVAAVAGPLRPRLHSIVQGLLRQGIVPLLAATPQQARDLVHRGPADIGILDASAAPFPVAPTEAPIIVITDAPAGPGVVALPPGTSADALALVAARMLEAQPPIPDLPLSYGRLRMEPAAYTASWGDVRLALTPSQFRLLVTLVGAGGAVVTMARLATILRLAAGPGTVEAVRAHVYRLRRRLRTTDADLDNGILNVIGVGYQMGPPC